MHILDLNHDVFLTLLSFTDRKDALSLAYTSRDAFSLTIPRIMEDVTLQTAERIKRFASLASKQPSRLAWVRRLRITPGVFYQNSKFPNLTKDIANFLCFVNNLTALCLPKAEGLLVSNPDLANHIASFPSLRIIEFEGIGQKIALLLSSMNSRPHRLCIESPLRDSPGLSPLASVQIWEAGRADLPQLLKDTQWPSVIEATWRRSSVSIYSLAYAFPNITTLHLSANTYNFCHHPGVNSCFGENPWNNLHHISGFLDDLATNINLLFPIRRLTISEDTPIGNWEVRDALEIVRRCSPVVLSLALYPQLEFSTALTHVLPRIRCLRTVLPDTATIEQIMNWIPTIDQHIGTLPLISYCLCVRRPYSVSIDDARSEWDLPVMLSYHVPSACFVALDVEEGGSRPIWWHVIRGPEGDVQTERVRNDLNDTVTEMLHSCDETTDIVPLVETYLKMNSGGC